jgi:hypothetical protein
MRFGGRRDERRDAKWRLTSAFEAVHDIIMRDSNTTTERQINICTGMPPSLVEALRREAEADQRTLGCYIRKILASRALPDVTAPARPEAA